MNDNIKTIDKFNVYSVSFYSSQVPKYVDLVQLFVYAINEHT